jgi:hypothetical protein
LGYNSNLYWIYTGVCKARYTHSVKLSYFTARRHICRKNCVNCAVLTDNCAGLRTVLSSCLSHRELRSSLRKSPQFPQFTCRSHDGIVSRHSNRWASHDIFLFKYQIPLLTPHFTLSFRITFVFHVASKQQTTVLLLSTIVTRKRRHTELTKKPDTNFGKPVLCQRTFRSVFRAVFYTVKLHSLTLLSCDRAS